jgi:hypothetical protein
MGADWSTDVIADVEQREDGLPALDALLDGLRAAGPAPLAQALAEGRLAGTPAPDAEEGAGSVPADFRSPGRSGHRRAPGGCCPG